MPPRRLRPASTVQRATSTMTLIRQPLATPQTCTYARLAATRRWGLQSASIVLLATPMRTPIRQHHAASVQPDTSKSLQARPPAFHALKAAPTRTQTRQLRVSSVPLATTHPKQASSATHVHPARLIPTATLLRLASCAGLAGTTRRRRLHAILVAKARPTPIPTPQLRAHRAKRGTTRHKLVYCAPRAPWVELTRTWMQLLRVGSVPTAASQVLHQHAATFASLAVVTAIRTLPPRASRALAASIPRSQDGSAAAMIASPAATHLRLRTRAKIVVNLARPGSTRAMGRQRARLVRPVWPTLILTRPLHAAPVLMALSQAVVVHRVPHVSPARSTRTLILRLHA